jgi:NADH-quinone oxidoreductase subunit C
MPGDEPMRIYGTWDGDATLERLARELPGAVTASADFRGETTAVVPLGALRDVLAFLRDDPECRFDMLTDMTAVHWPQRELPLDVVYHVYSVSRNVRLRIKSQVPADAAVPSAVAIWPAADWLERECYDMFGIQFADHPNLRRILMPEGYDGWPLRKEHPLKS